MSKAFTDSLVGSWLFTKSTCPDFRHREIHHFTSDAKNYWETEYEGKRFIHGIGYRQEGSILTMLHRQGGERKFDMVLEEDGSVCLPNPDRYDWWMIKLTSPEPYSIAFVGEDGLLEKLKPGQA